MLFKRNAISSLMLELDSDDLPQSRRGTINNSLAQEVVELTNIPDCAKNLIEYEKGIIELRGINPSNFLMSSSLGTRDVLKYFYQNIYYENDGSKQLVPNLSISELMIMLGVFSIIADSRKKVKTSYESKLKPIQRKNGKKFGYYLRKNNGLDELDSNMQQEAYLTRDIQEESTFIDIVSANIVVLESAIHSILGFKSEQKTKENLERIVKRSKELARSYTNIKEEYNRRRKEIPSLFDDVLLLECSGEYTDVLEAVYASEQTQKEYKKVFSEES